MTRKLKLKRNVYEFLKRRQRAYSVTFARIGFLRSSKTSASRHRLAGLAQPPEAAKGLAKTGGLLRGTMAGIMETNAMSGAKPPRVLLLKEYRSFRVSSHCLTDSAKPR